MGGDASHIVGQIKILDKTFRLLDALSAERPEWSVTGLAERLELPKSTAHRIASVLRGHRFLVQDPRSRRLRLGPMAAELGRRA